MDNQQIMEIIKRLEKELNQISTPSTQKSNKSHLGLANALHAGRVVAGPFGYITKERDPNGYAKLKSLHDSLMAKINSGSLTAISLLETSRDWA